MDHSLRARDYGDVVDVDRHVDAHAVALEDVERGVRANARKTKILKRSVQLLVPHARALFEAVQRLEQTQDLAPLALLEPGWRFHVDLLVEVPIDKCMRNINGDHVVVLERSLREDETHGGEANSGGEDLGVLEPRTL